MGHASSLGEKGNPDCYRAYGGYVLVDVDISRGYEAFRMGWSIIRLALDYTVPSRRVRTLPVTNRWWF